MANWFDSRRSRSAAWSARLSRFTVPVLIITVLGHRFDLIDTPSGLALLAACWAGAAMALLLAVNALRAIWRLGLTGMREALTGVLLSVPVLAIPIYFVVLLGQYPRLNDIATDTIDPPRFEAAATLRATGANPVSYPGEEAARRQIAAYPELRPFRASVSLAEAYDAVHSVVQDRGWRIIAEEPPAEDATSARIEAVARTLLMGFKDDVVIRIRMQDVGVRVDIRSASRYGLHDFGTNARRIQAFLFALREEIAPTAGGVR